MKKVLLALFLMSGFVSADFTITDESGTPPQSGFDILKLNIPTGSVQQYKINATNLVSNAAVRFQNISTGNMLLRFNAGVISKRQVIFKVSDDGKNYSSDYYALSSCEVDKSPDNRPTRSFFIINQGVTKFIKFSLRNCDTGEIINDKTEKLDLQTTLLAIKTQMSDNSVDPKGQNGSSAAYGLPAVIIAQKTTRDFSTRSATGKDEFLCKTRNNIQSLDLYDGSGKQITPFTYKCENDQCLKINFTIENKSGINYRKMHLKLTCQDGKNQQYYFDARPMEIRVSNLPNNKWLYAEQKYQIDGTAYDDGFSDAIEQIGSLANCDNCKVVAKSLESKKMNAITLNPVDAEGNTIESYNSIAEIAITGKIYSDGTNQNPINEKSGNALIRPCVAGSRANCEIAIAEINGATSEIYTDIVNKTKVLAYNNVGPTVLYGVDTEWTRYSQSQATPLCDVLESHDYEKKVEINGKNHFLVGCNIPFVPENKNIGDEISFYTFKPAVYKLLFESKNSPANDSYGTDKLTYIHTIKPDDYKNNKIFEAADFNASILAIGASLESLKNNRTLSHYDNHLKVANKLKFSGNPANPTIAIEGASTQNDIAADFRVTVNNDETDISGAIMLTLEPNNPYNHESGYNANPALTEITTDKNNITINSLKDKFYAGKNIKVNKLNLKREDLLARSYAHIGSSSVSIDINNPNNAGLNQKITDDKAAFISSYKGDDLNFVDAAIIAPNVASSGTTTDGAVYLAGYCESTSLTACKEIEVFISSAIAGHINYFGFRDIRGTATDNSLFRYEGAEFAQFKNGADFLGGFTADKVTIKLKGDKAEEYCNIFRNCYALGNGKFGTTFNSYKASIRQWHGSGDQGKTIVDSINEASQTTTRRKEQRLSF